jgi:hypothetical protein
MSAFRVSRTGFPFSQLSVTASISRWASIASATASRVSHRRARVVAPQLGAASCAASSAVSTSSAVDAGTSQMGSAVAGVRFTE